MKKIIKNYLLPLSVFVTGACVLIIEVVAVRILSPHYGNTMFTVSSVISIILAALSFGYYAGGKLADKYPYLKWFFGIILSSGIVLLLFHFFGSLLLPILSVKMSIVTGPLFTSLMFFFIPAFLLGTLSPYAVKLQSVNFPEEGVGSVSGKIFFWSTLGSISGSILAGFFLIPRFGVNNIIIVTAVILFLVGLIPLIFLKVSKKTIFQLILLFFLCYFFSSFTLSLNYPGVVYSEDGIYGKIIVYNDMFDGRPARFFLHDKSNSGAIFLDSQDASDLVHKYAKYYSVYEIFNPEVKNIFIIGGGVYSIAKAYLQDLSEAIVDVSEIEPSLFRISQKYFGLKENSRLNNYVQDGRRFLKKSKKKYDLIFGDAYHSLYSIPFHLTTLEFFNLVKEKLNKDGIFIANVIGDLSIQKNSFLISEIKTFQKVFENSYFFAVDSKDKAGLQNIIFIGYNSDKIIDFENEFIKSNNPLIKELLEKRINLDAFKFENHPILTDNFSPTDYMIAKAIKNSLKKR